MTATPFANTIRARVALATVVILAVGGVVVDEVVRHSARSSLDQRLLSEAESVASLARYDGERVELEFSPRCGQPRTVC